MKQKEKIIGFTYVFLLFAGITAGCCLLLFYYNTDFRIFAQKTFAISKMERIKEYQQAQNGAMMITDSLFSKIERFRPGVTAVYEENDIEFMIDELKNIYERHSWDTRYKSFLHVANFYSAWFSDKKSLWSKKENIIFLRKNLEECEIGLDKKKNELLFSSKK